VFRVTCDIFQDGIMDLAREVPLPPATEAVVRSHVEVCGPCAARLRRQRALTHGLRDVASVAASVNPSTEMEQRLLEAFSTLHEPPARRRTLSRAWLSAAAAVLVLATAGVWIVATLSRQGPAATERAASGQPRTILDGFMMLPVAAGLPALESGLIVRVDVPVSALPSYGVEVVTDSSKSQVQADLLIGQDGQPRAIRFVTGEGSSAGSSGPRSKP
jgi:hypothetical protein